MSTKKKRGLGHGLNEIVETRREISQQKARTKEILSQFQNRSSISDPDRSDQPDQIASVDTSISQIPVSENRVTQQIPVSTRDAFLLDTRIQQIPVSET